MDEPRTHYQLSFTARQALLLFVGLLGALAVAYFFGLMTGLAGREAPKGDVAAVETTPAPSPAPPASPTADTLEVPRAVRGISPPRGSSRTTLASPPGAGPAAPGKVPPPSPTPSLQLFEDASPAEASRSSRPSPAAAHGERSAQGRTPSHAGEPAAGSFWVQALSASSESEARSRRDRLAAHGFPSAVVPGPGPHGRVYRVRVGPFRTRPEAEHAATLLKTREKLEPWIVPPGK